MTSDPLLSALDCAAAVRRKDLSPVEVVDAALERIERLEPTLGAFVTVTADRARDEARAAERLLARSDADALPPLLGVPTAVKDLNQVAGVPTRFGSATMPDFVAPFDDHVVRRLRRAGAISLGKTATPEFGLSCYTETEIGPPTRNPWDPTRSPGGSSGGAAAAVAAGLVPVAQGSDGGGSIRIPASACGVVGLKPSRGRVSRGPVDVDVTGLAVLGPIARTVRDAALFLDVVSGPELGDTDALPAPPVGESFLSWCDRDPGRLRIGRFIDAPMSDGVDPEVFAAWEQASALLVSLGHDVVDVTAPLPNGSVPAFETVWAVSAATIPVQPSAEHLLTPVTKYLRARGAQVGGAEFASALALLRSYSREALIATADLDAVLAPTLARLPVPIGWFLAPDGDGAADFHRQERFTPFTAIYNCTGQPAISLPLHWTAEGLPVGVMLAGRPAGEGPLLALAAQVEHASPSHDRRPPVWAGAGR